MFVTLIRLCLLLTKLFSLFNSNEIGLVVPKLLSTTAYRQKNNVIAGKSSLIKYSSRHARRFWELQVKPLTLPASCCSSSWKSRSE